jgi:hypothetical protein
MDTSTQAEEEKQRAKPGPKPKAQLAAIDPAQYAADMLEIKTMFAGMTEIMKSMQLQALHNPVSIRKEAYNTEIPDQVQTFGAPNGEFKVLDEIGFETASGVKNPGVDKYYADMAMLEDELEVFTPEGQDPKDTCFAFTNNGKMQIFIRGTTQKIKRKYVEMALRLRQRNYQSVENKDRDAEEYYLQRMTSSIRHAIQIVYDPNPRGREWREKLIGQR